MKGKDTLYEPTKSRAEQLSPWRSKVNRDIEVNLTTTGSTSECPPAYLPIQIVHQTNNPIMGERKGLPQSERGSEEEDEEGTKRTIRGGGVQCTE